MICSKCGATIPDDSKFCVRCGNKIEKTETTEITNAAAGKGGNASAEITCPGCGAAIKPGAKFCTKCGRKLEAAAQPKPAAEAAAQPKPAAETAAQPKPAAAGKEKASKKPVLIMLVVFFILIGVLAGAGYYFIGVCGINPVEAVSGLFGSEKSGGKSKDTDKDSEDNDSQGDSEGEKGDVTLLEPADQLVEEAKAEYEAENYAEGAIPLCLEAMNQYISVAEENHLQEEAQAGIDSVYWIYVDSVIRYCDIIKGQGANSAGFEQINNTLTKATTLITTLTEKGYSVDSDELYTYREDIIQAFRDMYIESINDITEYENWSRDEAWSYAEQAYSIKENGKPILFDDENLEDPLRMRYVYCLAWVTRKRCETGLADGSLTKEDVVKSMEAILEETDYNLLLIQDIITYGSEAGMDVEKYRNAYNAIVDQIKSGQGLTISSDIGVNSVSSVDSKHFWYFNDLDGEEKYKVDTHNGTTAATREWIRNNVPVILGE